MRVNPRSLAVARRGVCIALAVFGLLAFAHRAAAQGSLGYTPDPITVLERERLAESLNLPADAKAAFDAAHELYLEQCRALRDGPVESLIERIDVLSPNSLHGAAPYDEARRALRDWQGAWDRFTGIERTLLASWLPIVSPSQRQDFEDFTRRRRLQQLTANGVVQFFLRHNALLDLRAVVDELNLDEHSRERLEPILREYEAAQIVQLDRIWREGFDARSRLLQALDRDGFPSESWRDGTATSEAYQAAIAHWWNTEADAQEAYRAFQSEQMSRALALADQLPAEEAFTVRGAAAWAHGLTFLRNRMIGHSMTDLLLDDPEIEEQTRESLESIRQQIFERHRRIAHDLIDLHRADRGSNIMGSPEYRIDEEERMAKRRQMTQTFVEFDRSVQEQIAALLPDERMKAVRQQDQENRRARGDAIIAEYHDVARFGRMSESDIAFMPPRITPAEVEAIALLLDLDDAVTAHWNEALAQFLTDTNERHTEWCRQLHAAVPDYTLDEENRTLIPPALDSITAFPAALTEIRNRVRAAEGSLHTSLIESLPSDDALRSRAAALLEFDRTVRATVQSARSVSETASNFTGHRANPISVIARARLPMRERDAAVAALLDRRAEVEAACANAFERSLQGFLADWRYRRGMHDQTFQSRDEAEAHPMTQDLWRHMDAWRAARRSLIRTMRDVIDGIAEELAPIPAERLRNAYRQAAWTRLYDDSAALFDWFGRAIALERIDDERVVELTLRQDDYRRAYEALTERMVRTIEASPSMEIRARDVFAAFYDRRHRVATVQRWWWERRELSTRAWFDAMALLTEEEREKLRAHEPPFDGELFMW